MESFFLDQGIIIGYASYIGETVGTQNYIDSFALASIKFFQLNKGREFATCFYITQHDLPRFRKRRKIVLEELRKKLQQASYEIGSSDRAREFLWSRDIEWAKKIYMLSTLFPEKQFLEMVLRIESLLEARIDYLLHRILSDIVVPIKDINIELRSHLLSYIQNFSDCNVIASAIQYNTELANQDREGKQAYKTGNVERTIVITTDKKDWQDVDKWLGMNLKLERKYKMPRWIYLPDAIKEK